MQFKISSAAVLAVALSSTPAMADDFSFEYRSHELKTSEGAAVVYERLEQAAANFCVDASVRSPRDRYVEKQCIAEAVDAVVVKLGHPVISSLHNGGQSIVSR